MSLFKKIKRILGVEKQVEEPDADIEEIIKMLNTPHVDNRRSIEKVQLKSNADIDVVIEKLTGEKIVIVDIAPLIRRKKILKQLIKKLRNSCEMMSGQICRISNELILIVPGNMNVRAGMAV